VEVLRSDFQFDTWRVVRALIDGTYKVETPGDRAPHAFTTDRLRNRSPLKSFAPAPIPAPPARLAPQLLVQRMDSLDELRRQIGRCFGFGLRRRCALGIRLRLCLASGAGAVLASGFGLCFGSGAGAPLASGFVSALAQARAQFRRAALPLLWLRAPLQPWHPASSLLWLRARAPVWRPNCPPPWLLQQCLLSSPRRRLGRSKCDTQAA